MKFEYDNITELPKVRKPHNEYVDIVRSFIRQTEYNALHITFDSEKEMIQYTKGVGAARARMAKRGEEDVSSVHIHTDRDTSTLTIFRIE